MKEQTLQLTHENMQVQEKPKPQPPQISKEKMTGVPMKRVFFIVFMAMMLMGIVVFLPTYFFTKQVTDPSLTNTSSSKIPSILKAQLTNNTFEECNKSLIGNTTLALSYADGTYTTVQPAGGSLDQAINSLFIVRKEWTPSKAVCGNYPLSTILALNLNSSSCTGCLIAQGTCSKCTDKLFSNNIGSLCIGCVINGANGICGACQVCSPISTTASCSYSSTSITLMNLDGISCSGCSGTTCGTCLDKTNSGSVGTSCTNCTSQNGIGYCKVCSSCTRKVVYANCENSQNSFNQLGLLYNSCFGCVNGVCSVCIDSSKNGNKGTFCTQCTHTGVDVGYCTQCAICTPVKVLSNCLNMRQYLNLNENSCKKCSKMGSVTTCQICYDRKAVEINGTYCRQCWITNSNENTGYCNECQICSNIQTSAVCANQPRGILSLLGNSCSNCWVVGTSVICNICTDRFKKNYIGSMCEPCVLVGQNGYCQRCKVCSYSTNEAQCQQGGPLVKYLSLSSQLLCTSCYYLAGQGYCKQCTDKNLNGNKGFQCSGCTLYNKNQGTCTSCQMCTPIFTSANCPNNYVPLNLNQTSCQKCKIMGSTTTCQLCRDRFLNHVAYNCSNCFITKQNKGFCSDCLTCPLPSSINRVSCYNSGTYLNLDLNSCSGCAGSTCSLCIDKYNSQLKGYSCDYCTVAGSQGYCRGSCRACIPVKSYTNCVNSWASFSRLALGELSCTGCSGTTCGECTDVTGNGNKGYNCAGCTIVEGDKGFCSPSYSCSLCTPVKTYTNSGFSIVEYIQLKEDSCSGCSGNTCANCTDFKNSSIVGYNCVGCTVFKGDKGYCSPSYSCSVTVPVSTYTNCNADLSSVIILKLNSTSCSECVGTTCAKCTDYVNGNVGYNCNGCTAVNGKFGYCSPSYSCSRCAPILATASCGNSNNAYLYLNLNETSCSKCTGSTCTTCQDKNNYVNIGTSCSSCTLVFGDTGFCTYCATCS